MRPKHCITNCFLAILFLFLTAAAEDSILSRAGRENWYQWLDPKGDKNGYSHETYTKIDYKGKPALKTLSALSHKNQSIVNEIALTLISSDLEPLLEMTVVAVEKGDGKEFKTSMSAKPGPDGYVFAVDRNGKKETRKVARADFDYFDFEDHYLYSAQWKGEPRKFRVLNSFTLGIESRTVQCQGEEKIKINGKKVLCLKYTCASQEYTTTLWKEKASGNIVKQTFPNGASILLSDADAAKSI